MLERMTPYRLTVGLALAVVYLAAQALTGQLGLLSARTRAAELADRQAQAVALEREREELEVRRAFLSDDNLSRDLLEERARALLGFGHPRDLIVTVAAPQAEAARPGARS